MEPTLETIQVLNDLLAIHSGMIRGYENAMSEMLPDKIILKTIFARMVLESKSISIDLENTITGLEGQHEKGTMATGKLYHAWNSMQPVFTGQDYLTILVNCGKNEIATGKAYEEALHSGALPDPVYKLVQQQQQTLSHSNEIIKKLRDELNMNDHPGYT